MYGTAVYQASWELKAQIDGATKVEDIPSVPDTIVIPSALLVAAAALGVGLVASAISWLLD
ncbi:hypothetical protein BTHE68_71880 (plasmid) [Burkholderia sp. THE68]|nr:hypothetical protein BTHE68_71880 [Burkholderia sp. THE68]